MLIPTWHAICKASGLELAVHLALPMERLLQGLLPHELQPLGFPGDFCLGGGEYAVVNMAYVGTNSFLFSFFSDLTEKRHPPKAQLPRVHCWCLHAHKCVEPMKKCAEKMSDEDARYIKGFD